MAKGEAKALLEGYRAALREVLSRFDEPSVRRLRGEIQVAVRWLAAREDVLRSKAAQAALDAVTRLYQFGAEIGGFTSSRKAAERASLFELGSIGILAAENVLTAEKITPMRLLMSGLSEGLTFLSSRQYVHGSNALLEATYRTHSVLVEDALWELASDLRGRGNLAAIREANAAIESLLTKLEDAVVPVGTKVAVVHEVYALIAIARCIRLLDALSERGRVRDKRPRQRTVK